MANPLTMKLQRGAALTEEDRRELDTLVRGAAHLPGREVVVSEGEPGGVVHVLLSGWACRFKTVPGAARQIIAFMLPGDHSPIHSRRGRTVTYGLCALTPCEILEIDEHELEALFRARPNIGQAFRWSSITNEAVLQEWLANVGQRSAERRLAHLLCELLFRLQAVGLASPAAFPMPLTQSTLGDALGLSSAHINRTLQALRVRGLVFFENGAIELSSPARLQTFAGFNPGYLNLERAEAEASS